MLLPRLHYCKSPDVFSIDLQALVIFLAQTEK